VKLTTQFHLVPRSKNALNYTSTPPWRGAQLKNSTGTTTSGFFLRCPRQMLGQSLETGSYLLGPFQLVITNDLVTRQRRDSSVGIALGYGRDDWGSRIRFPLGAGNFYRHHRVQNGSGAHPASYPIGSRGSFLGGKAAGAWS
jgi:hypothetical protein